MSERFNYRAARFNYLNSRACDSGATISVEQSVRDREPSMARSVRPKALQGEAINGTFTFHTFSTSRLLRLYSALVIFCIFFFLQPPVCHLNLDGDIRVLFFSFNIPRITGMSALCRLTLILVCCPFSFSTSLRGDKMPSHCCRQL